MHRIEIEIELHRGRVDTLEWVASLSEEESAAPRTHSGHDPDSWWSPWADGTVGGVLPVHAAHARLHRQWSETGTPAGW